MGQLSHAGIMRVALIAEADPAAAVVDREAVQTELGGPGNAVRRSVLWPRGLAGGPEDPDARPDLDDLGPVELPEGGKPPTRT